MSLAEDIKQKALQLGFDLVGITDASPIDANHIEALTNWLKAGCAGQMSYMHRNLEKRINPANLLENAQSVIVVGLNYKSSEPEHGPQKKNAPMGKVAAYAQYEDYHLFIKKQLRKLTDFITSLAGDDHKFKICVDSAPLAERIQAQRAGLGFIGKNRMLINPTLGPQILLGEIITTLKLPTDKPITTDCTDCNRCIAACPSGALGVDGQFDARKCVSYLTIEHDGEIPSELADKIGNRLFGCDECVLACPYQKDAPVCKNDQFKFCTDRAELNLHDILNMTEEDFERKFADSAFARSGLDRLKANARICLTNVV